MTSNNTFNINNSPETILSNKDNNISIDNYNSNNNNSEKNKKIQNNRSNNHKMIEIINTSKNRKDLLEQKENTISYKSNNDKRNLSNFNIIKASSEEFNLMDNDSTSHLHNNTQIYCGQNFQFINVLNKEIDDKNFIENTFTKNFVSRYETDEGGV